MSTDYISSQPHIDKIRDALAVGREYGRAALMIGSGFSLNARSVSTSMPSFPTWRTLMDSMVKEIVRSGKESDDLQKMSGSVSGALRIAEEYVALHGRANLDMFLKKQIPDNQFHPSLLHRKALELPWSDIFTTNWDTLIERTALLPISRRYGVVLAVCDITQQIQPRIIKLHGSFPSNGPFVLTEEDFRTYPSCFAPFVNLVQQSMMENIFCLIGFSGVDPNFLAWSGWVRDNLGAHASQIYLCGVLNLRQSEKKVLHERGVIPIDLSELFKSSSVLSTAEKNKIALNWFFDNLFAGQPPEEMQWPESVNGSPSVDPGLPAIPPYSGGVPKKEKWNAEYDNTGLVKDDNSRFQALRIEIYAWRHNRTLYPGWLLAPHQTREKIWHNTKHWLSVAIEANTVWSERQLLVLWRELTWRLGICLQIVPDEALDSIRRIVDEVGDLFHDDAEVDTGEFFPKTEGWPSDFAPTAQELQECWVVCKLALLQGYRIRPDIEAFEEIENQFDTMRELSVDQRCFVLYQSCLGAMAELDTDRTHDLLAKWPNQPEDDYWLVKKAAVLLELGDLPAAKRVVDDALQRIRGRPQTRYTDYWKLSREGWCLRLLAHVEFLERYSSVDVAVDVSRNFQDSEEWTNSAWKSRFDHRLEAARCSPDAELRALQGLINKRPSPVKPSQRVANPPGFDTGDINQSIRFTQDIPSDRLAPAINLLLASDVIGYLPYLPGDIGMYAMSWIRDEFPGLWSTFALRFGGIGVTQDPNPSEKTKPDSIRRTTLEQLPKQHIERLFNATFQELVRTVERAQAGKNSRMIALRGGVLASAAGLSDIVTRFSMCLNADAREKLLELLFQAVRIPRFRQCPDEQDVIRHLVERSIPYLEKEQWKHWFFRILLNIPLNSSDDNQRCFLPSIAENLWLSKIYDVKRNESGIDAGIRQLIDGVGSSDIVTRTDAAQRLLLLVDLKLLSEEEKDDFTKALWKKLDNCNLPAINDKTVHKHVHVNWPEETEGQIVQGLAKWIISGGVEDRFSDAGTNGGEVQNKTSAPLHDPGMYLPNIFYLAQRLGDDPETFENVFNEKNRKHILESIFDWWEREKFSFGLRAIPSMTLFGDVFDRVDLCLQVIFECTLGKEGLDEKVRERMNGLLDDIEDFGKSSPYKYPILAHIDREGQIAAWNGIRSSLWSSDQKIKALIAARQWQRGAKRLKLMPMPANVLTIIVSSIASLDGTVGYHGCQVLKELIEKDHIQMENDVLQEIVAAVESAANKLAHGGNHVGMSVSDAEKRVHFRRRLAELIICLANHGGKVGPVGIAWIEDAKEDSFVDIRRIAREWRK